MPDDAVPAAFEHAHKVYNTMLERSTPEDLPNLDDPVQVYEGHLTTLFQELRLSTPYYSSIMKLLVEMGCAVQLRRGGGNAKSRWAVITPPTMELYDKAMSRHPRVSKRENEFSILQQQLRDLAKRIARLEKEGAA